MNYFEYFMDRIIILYSKMNIMPNSTSNESEKILESLFEPDNAEILLELKNGPKPLSVLTEKIAISEGDLDEKLSSFSRAFDSFSMSSE